MAVCCVSSLKPNDGRSWPDSADLVVAASRQLPGVHQPRRQRSRNGSL